MGMGGMEEGSGPATNNGGQITEKGLKKHRELLRPRVRDRVDGTSPLPVTM